VKSPVEKIILVRVYHDGPVTGLSGDRRRAHYFEAPFDDDIDEYSDLYKVLKLNENQQSLFDELFDNNQLSRYSKSSELNELFALIDAELKEKSQIDDHRFRVCRPNFIVYKGGSTGSYTVEWEDVNP
jgi:hypothetical protein